MWNGIGRNIRVMEGCWKIRLNHIGPIETEFADEGIRATKIRSTQTNNILPRMTATNWKFVLSQFCIICCWWIKWKWINEAEPWDLIRHDLTFEIIMKMNGMKLAWEILSCALEQCSQTNYCNFGRSFTIQIWLSLEIAAKFSHTNSFSPYMYGAVFGQWTTGV